MIVKLTVTCDVSDDKLEQAELWAYAVDTGAIETDNDVSTDVAEVVRSIVQNILDCDLAYDKVAMSASVARNPANGETGGRP